MPELPEVETVRNVLKLWVNGKTIKGSNIYYEKVLDNIVFSEFETKIVSTLTINKLLIIFIFQLLLLKTFSACNITRKII